MGSLVAALGTETETAAAQAAVAHASSLTASHATATSLIASSTLPGASAGARSLSSSLIRHDVS